MGANLLAVLEMQYIHKPVQAMTNQDIVEFLHARLAKAALITD